MKKTIMIKKNYEFKKIFSKGKFYHGEHIHMYIGQGNFDYNKLGIAISKKSGKAVKRNKVKRLVRENYKGFEEKIKTGYNILVIINKKKNIEEASFYNIKEDFYKILKKANMLIN